MILQAICTFMLISLYTVHASIDLCGVCKKEECMPPLECKGEMTLDSCGCCRICTRGEAEMCGGIHSQIGKCKDGLVCKIRDPKSRQNTYLPPGSKVGRCEPEMCSNVTCGMHQWCSVVKSKAKCICTMKCGNKLEPVCGLSDGKDYRNPCKVKERECKLQIRIGYLDGYCEGCMSDGREYKVGESILGKKKCEKCTCSHRNWVCSLEERCLKEEVYNGYQCTGYTAKHAPIECPDGYKCNITKKGTDGFADRGFCQKLIPGNEGVLLFWYTGDV